MFLPDTNVYGMSQSYQYDVPFGEKGDDFYDEAMDHTNMMKKSWEGDK